MAQKVQVTLIDDLDNESEAHETVTFALDGKSYEIDLNDKNAAKLRKYLSPYITAGRRTGSTKGRGKFARPQQAGDETAKIRSWAKQNGYEVNDRGRVPQTIRDAYAKAQG
jgi:hypothetical protein